jgi:pimeloyl-ACP methyl ester carboxylesterase
MIDINTKIMIGGIKQRIHIKTDDASKPVLLFLHGGPGVCNRHNIMTAHLDLLDTFTIATWDQRGSGGSAYGVKDDQLTIRRLTDDAAELVEWLCANFGKDKIFVIGGSWGSELGTWLCSRYPEHIAAFVGFGQVVNGAENERISWEFCMNEARKAGDVKAMNTLLKVGPPVMGIYKGGFDGMMAQRNVMMKYGGYSKQEGKQSYFESMVKPILLSGEYSPSDLAGYISGYKRVLKVMWAEVGATDFPKTCTKFDVPFFILDGRLDMNTPAELVEDWYNMIEAPEKDLVWFENSGHNPMNDEPEAFKRVLREKLMAVKDREECRI